MSAVYDLLDRAVPPGLAPQLAEVVSVEDEESLGRVEIRLLSYDAVDGQDAPLWARVAVPFAGADRGAFWLPDRGDEVLVVFAAGDPRFPVVVGGLWSQSQPPPDELGGDRVDRWVFVGRAGTRVGIVEEESPTVEIETPGGVKGTWTDEEGGAVRIEASGSTVTIDSEGVTVETGSKVKVQASEVSVTAGQVKVDAAMSKFSGMVKCDVLQTNSVISTSYTPGAGNVW